MSFVNNLFVNNNAVVVGNLDVRGTTTTINSVNVNIKDRYLYINNDYTTNTGITGGLVINYLPTAYTTTVAVGGFVTSTTVRTTVVEMFPPGSIIQISGTTGNVSNSGIFVVLSHEDNVLTIDTTATFAQTVFIVDTTTGGNITKINVALMQVSANGVWQSVTGNDVDSLITKNMLLSGDPITNASITLTDETNQIHLGTNGVVTLTAPSESSSTVTFPDTAGSDDTIVYTTLAQTIFNKTFKSPQINSTSSNNNYVFGVKALTANRTVNLPLLIADDTFVFESHIQTLSNKTFTSPQINDISSNNQYVFGVNELTANRTVTLPLLIANDTFVFESHIQTLSNKTLDNPSVTGQVLAPNGTSSAPSYSFTTNPDTGLTIDTDSINLIYNANIIFQATDTNFSFNPNVTLSVKNIIQGVKNYTLTTGNILATDGERTNIYTFNGVKDTLLPTAPTNGKQYTFINGETGVLTINRGGTDTIDDGVLTSLALPNKYQRVTLIYVSTVWYIV